MPDFNFSNMPPWRETQGYQVKVDGDVRFNYPAPQEEEFVAAASNIDHKNTFGTDKNMSLLVNKIIGNESIGDRKIDVLDATGTIVGSGVIDSEGRCGLAVWGDDATTQEKDGLIEGESFTLRLKEKYLKPVKFYSGEALMFEKDGFVVIDAIVENAVPLEYYLSAVYPNPFNNVTRVQYGLPEAVDMKIQIVDISGRLVETLHDGFCSAGHYSIVWNAGRFCSGIYFIRMEAGEFGSVRKVILVR